MSPLLHGFILAAIFTGAAYAQQATGSSLKSFGNTALDRKPETKSARRGAAAQAQTEADRNFYMQQRRNVAPTAPRLTWVTIPRANAAGSMALAPQRNLSLEVKELPPDNRGARRRMSQPRCD